MVKHNIVPALLPTIQFCSRTISKMVEGLVHAASYPGSPPLFSMGRSLGTMLDACTFFVHHVKDINIYYMDMCTNVGRQKSATKGNTIHTWHTSSTTLPS